MPKKVPPRNPFFFYMEHFKEQQRKKGKTYPGGMKEVAEACSDLWKNLNPGERAVYEEKARREKQKMNVPEKKFTSTGQSYADIEAEERLKKKMQQMERDTIGSIIKNNAYANKLDTYPFYLMDVNCYCRTTSDQYVIAELTIARFSLANGLLDFYHENVNPGQIPVGYASDAKIACQTFGLDMPDPATYDPDNMRKMKSVLYDYLTPEEGDEVPPIFTLTDRVPMVKNFLQTLFETYSFVDKHLMVYRLDLLFFYLVNGIKSAEYEGFPKESIATMELQKDRFQYNPNLACELHEANPDKAHFCSQSRIKRWAFIIMDQCCPMLGIESKAGVHLPDGFAVGEIDMVVSNNKERLKTTVELPLESETNSVNTTLNDDTIDSEQGRRNAWGVSDDMSQRVPAPSSSRRDYAELRRPASRSVYASAIAAAPKLEDDMQQLSLESANWPALSGGRAGRGRGRTPMN